MAHSDADRLAVEIIATLVNVKKIAAERVLRPAGVDEDLIVRFLKDRDSSTGERRSKRDAGVLVLEEQKIRHPEHTVTRNLISLAAEWEDFYLAHDEYRARAVVQKAREVRGILIDRERRERAEDEKRRNDAAEKEAQEKVEQFSKQSSLLLAQFDQATIDKDHQRRGYLLQDLLTRTFDLYGISVRRAFCRNAGGEQIDGAFEMDGWHYIVECRWRDRLADIRQLDGLSGQIVRSGRQTMGLFLSINGWSENVIPLLKQNPDKTIFLMEGYDLRTVLSTKVHLRNLLKAKLSALNLDSEPYFSISQLSV